MKQLKILNRFYFLFIVTFALSYCVRTYGNLSGELKVKIHIKSDSTKRILFTEDSLNTSVIEDRYGMIFYNNRVVFVMDSRKKYDLLADYIDYGNYDTYMATITDHTFSNITFFCPDFTFPYPPGTFSFTNENLTLYFTKPVNVKNGIQKKMGIFKTTMSTSDKDVDGFWNRQFELLPFCNKEYSCMHPALSKNGEMLVFSSDQPDSITGFNLFYVKINKSGYTAPESLGEKINSIANEIYPFLDNSNNLFFSSNRQDGLGGYDIYFSEFNGDTWDSPVNLGTTINTINDELMFKLNNSNTLASCISVQKDKNPHLRLLNIAISGQKEKPATKTIRQGKIPPLTLKKNAGSSNKSFPVRKSKTAEKNDKTVQNTTESKDLKEKTSVSGTFNKEVKKQEPLPVLFRVQLLSSSKSKGNFKITINQVDYTAFEYFYKGAYRYTIGEFDDLNDAVTLSGLCRKNGYAQAFVVAFKGHKRILDPSVFKR